VYVADTFSHRIQRFDAQGAFLTKWGSQGSGDGQFNGPGGVAVLPSCAVAVTDLGNHRVQVFQPNG
jgi:DNA-binding beta-propeller fold protein YncE